jgi:hypothetical protein
VEPGEKPRIGRKRMIALGAGALAVAAASAFGGWAVARSDRDRIPALERRLRALEAASKATAAERDRVKAERDRLEAQIAAANQPARACAKETVSTSPDFLLALFTVEYPCGWNLLEQPLQSAADPPGLQVDHLFVSASPISLAPREGPLTEITVSTWYDDPNVEGDALPPLDQWKTTARGRFRDVKESTLTTRSGIPVSKLTGTMIPFDEPRPALLYVWEFTDRSGARRICEAFALDPSRTVTQTIETLVRSFRPLGA